MSEKPCNVLIAGGGIAGIEALLALTDLAGDRAAITLLARDREFTYRPMIVDEPFSLTPAARHDLGALTEELGARFVQGTITEVAPEKHLAILSDGSEVPYDVAVVCVGAGNRPAFPSATTLRSWNEPIAIGPALDAAAAHASRTITFVVPPGVVWSLPLYELAMLSQRLASERNLDLKLAIVTPEAAPLSIFGKAAAAAVADLLAARGIEVTTEALVVERGDGFVAMPAGARIDSGAVVALPILTGPAITGLPADPEGFIQVDEFGAVRGVADVFAAGDGTTFPIKQGGLATQQADAVAEVIAARVGAAVDPQPFRPVLRGKLITGPESLNLSSADSGADGDGVASPGYLWWPPQKVAGRYLSPFLAGTTAAFDPEPPEHSIDVEVSVPAEWHSQPMTP